MGVSVVGVFLAGLRVISFAVRAAAGARLYFHAFRHRRRAASPGPNSRATI